MPISPPRPKAPPLNALRAFEAAARLGGFAAAANELCVTPGAVAQQVKALEAWAGAALFDRRSQGVRLTALGAGVAAEFSAAFDRLGDAAQSLRRRATPTEIRIAALPSIAQLWLSPRLPVLRAGAPEITLSVTALETRPNLAREPFDMAIFFEDLPLPPGVIGLDADILFPVCAPEIAARLQHPADLAGETRLHDAAWSDDWALWARSAMPERRLDSSGPVFSLYSLAVEMAKNGAGVLMGHEPLLRAELATGSLVAPFDIRVPLARSLAITLAQPAPADTPLGIVVQALSRPQGN